MRNQDGEGYGQGNGGGYGPGDWWTNNLPQVNTSQASTGGPTGNAPPVTTPTTPTPNTGGDFRTWFQQATQGRAPNIQTLLALKAEIEARGGRLIPNATLGPDGMPTNYDVQLPDGSVVDVLQGASRGGEAWQWLTGDGGSGNGGQPTGDPRYPQDILTPWTKEFHARSPDEIAQDPAYQFQLQQGLQGVERGAAAKGTLLTGGTLKALTGYGQGLASTFNDKYYGRDMQEYLLGRENFYNNQDRPYTKLSGLAALGKPTGGG